MSKTAQGVAGLTAFLIGGGLALFACTRHDGAGLTALVMGLGLLTTGVLLTPPIDDVS